MMKSILVKLLVTLLKSLVGKDSSQWLIYGLSFEPNNESDCERVTLIRTESGKKQTLGTLIYKGKEVAKTVELAWRYNQAKISCIPCGEYQVVRRSSPKYGDHFHILEVPGRSLILIHIANYFSDLLGCIGVGESHTDINGDGLRDVTRSGPKMKQLLALFPKTFKLTIIDAK